MLADVVEVSVTGPGSSALYFPPLQRTLRGHFNPRDVRDPAALGVCIPAWPESGVPGQVIGLRPDGTAFIREPLHAPEHGAIRSKVASLGLTLPPEVEELGQVHVPTWTWWLKRSIEANGARLTKGTLPDKVEGKPQLQFIAPEQPDERDKRLARLERQNERLMAALIASLPADKRRALERDLGTQE